MDIFNEMLEELNKQKGILPQAGGGSDCITIDDLFKTKPLNVDNSSRDRHRIISLLEEISKKLDYKEASSTLKEVRDRYGLPEFKSTSPVNSPSGNHIILSSSEESGLTRKNFDELVSQLGSLLLVYGNLIDFEYISKDEIKIGSTSIKFVEGKK